MKIFLHFFFRKRRSSRMVSHTQIVEVIIVVRLVLEIRPIDCMNMIHWHCIRRCKVLSTMVKIPAWMKTQALCQTYLFWKVSKSSVRLKCCVWMIRNSMWRFLMCAGWFLKCESEMSPLIHWHSIYWCFKLWHFFFWNVLHM